MELESIGRNIRKFRLMRNLRQEDLAEMAGLSINYVGALERGEKIPSLETFIVLLNALEVSSDMVLSSLLVEKHQADASRLMDRMQNLPAYDIERILAVVDVLIQYPGQSRSRLHRAIRSAPADWQSALHRRLLAAARSAWPRETAEPLLQSCFQTGAPTTHTVTWSFQGHPANQKV